jgi:Protein of unknown function (DUF3108)
MILSRYRWPFVCLTLLLTSSFPAANAQAPAQATRFPYAEKLTYGVEWRLLRAGSATIQLSRDERPKDWNFNLNIESSGFVSRVYRVLDSYKVTAQDGFCLSNATLDAQEGKKHSISNLQIDNSRREVIYDERDLIRNHSQRKELAVPPCTYEIVGALATLRTFDLEPGHSRVIPITDGKKFAQVKIEAQAKERINVGGKRYETTRYEAYLFDGVLYQRRGRLLVWISNDSDRLPVQFRLLLHFPIGTITVALEKQEK